VFLTFGRDTSKPRRNARHEKQNCCKAAKSKRETP
jgi:hypothetical protein